jgi:hypothetical protein
MYLQPASFLPVSSAAAGQPGWLASLVRHHVSSACPFHLCRRSRTHPLSSGIATKSHFLQQRGRSAMSEAHSQSFCSTIRVHANTARSGKPRRRPRIGCRPLSPQSCPLRGLLSRPPPASRATYEGGSHIVARCQEAQRLRVFRSP